jgi:hypothetical protein
MTKIRHAYLFHGSTSELFVRNELKGFPLHLSAELGLSAETCS